jgi:hypothetical protein
MAFYFYGNEKGLIHKVHMYLEYHSVNHPVRIGNPYSLSQKRVCTPPPPRNQRGERTRLRVRGWGGGVPIRTTGEKA